MENAGLKRPADAVAHDLGGEHPAMSTPLSGI
jgi:hypothetical protein